MNNIEKLMLYIKNEEQAKPYLASRSTETPPLPDSSGGHDAALPFPTRTVKDFLQREILEYLIPENRKLTVLKQLYPFAPMPTLADRMFDIHANRFFRVGEYRVVRFNDINWLVSPYYTESGGSVIDWISETQMGDRMDDILLGNKIASEESESSYCEEEKSRYNEEQ